MGLLYLAALILGGGTVLLQLVMSGDSDADAEIDGVLDMDGAETDADHGQPHDVTGGILPIFLSLRFWTFGLLAFGLAGTLFYYLDILGEPMAVALSAVLGLSCGAFASWTFSALTRAELTSGTSTNEAVGQVGRVLLPLQQGQRGKIRVSVRGQTWDLTATTDDPALMPGELVLIEEMRGETAHVAKAPRDFLPPGSA